ncbi:MAG: NAD(P)-binding domain-containing protein [Nitrospinae bacterium]|nr:NAD(P)-binding domain-containing protein [Nitrospinota bacterium]
MSDKIRLLVTDGASGRFLSRVKANPASAPFEIIAPESAEEDALLALAPEAEAVLCYKAALPASVIHAATKLRYIQKHGLNCKNIAVEAARERGVPVGTQSLMRNATVAEQALTLMLCCERKTIPGQKAVEAGVYREMGIEPVATSQWNIRPNWPEIEGVAELFGKSAGIIGLGDIGMDIARRCAAFDMEIFYYQRTRHEPDVEAEYRATYLDFDDLLARVDYLVLVLPHTAESEGMIGAEQLARMKETATLINVGRGALVDEAALARALEQGEIAMAGLDVYQYEPLPYDSPLIGLPNAVLLPHTGGGSNRQWDVDIPASLGKIAAFFGGDDGGGKS